MDLMIDAKMKEAIEFGAKELGISKEEFLKGAIVDKLGEIDEIRAIEEWEKKKASGKAKTYTTEEIVTEHGLAI
jgi:hypothetical protein